MQRRRKAVVLWRPAITLLKQDTAPYLFALRKPDYARPSLDFLAPVKNMKGDATVSSRIEGAVLLKAPRSGGPSMLEEISDSALERWRSAKEVLPERELYRPKPLDGAAAAIEAGEPFPQPQAAHPDATNVALAQPTAGALYKIVYGCTLSALALRLYGAADLDTKIVDANRFIEDPNTIFVGQFIYLPPL